MKCFYHPDRDAVTTCSACGHAVCSECEYIKGSHPICRNCSRNEVSAHKTHITNSGNRGQINVKGDLAVEEEYEHIFEIDGKYYHLKSNNPDPDVALEEARAKRQTLWEYVEPWKRKFGIVCLVLGIIGLIAFPTVVFTLGTGEAYEVGILIKGLIGSFICVGTGLQFNKFFNRISLT
jgi:hypothetical protein